MEVITSICSIRQDFFCIRVSQKVLVYLDSALFNFDSAQISSELGLHGFVLPGKPGIICVEGPAEDVQQFYAAIRR